MTGMATKPVAPVTAPSADVGDILRHLIGDTGRITDSMDGYKIAVDHTRAFPWDDVLKTLLYRDFRVNVTRHKADIYIEASP